MHPEGLRSRLTEEEGSMFAPELASAFAPRKGLAPTRRGILHMMGGVVLTGATPMFAFAADFWNRKDPQEWSGEEINQIATKSPWAKEVSASYTPPGGGSPDLSTGLGGHRSREAPGIPSQVFKGTIRWESAKPVMEALKAPLAEVFANHYVINVTGFPANELGGRKAHSQDPNPSMESTLDHLKGVSFLQVKDKGAIQPGVVQQPPSGRFGTTILFGFSKESLNLTVEDKEVVFVTEFGRLNLKVKFNLKDMMYHGELAV